MAIIESNGKTVLVTGINGYIAGVLGLQLLQKGYDVRGTSRRASSTDPLLKGPYAPYADRFKVFEVPDMTIDGAFDEAVQGVHGIFHTASPVNFALDTYEDTIGTAVKGSTILLESALKAGSQLSSVVITSSVTVVTNPDAPTGHIFSEADPPGPSLDKANKIHQAGGEFPRGLLYGASKIAADKAVWDFRNNRTPSFAISAILPSVVIGPPIILPGSGEKFNETLKPIWALLSGEAKSVPPSIGSGSFVDVRDVGKIHIWAFENSSKADGERYIACNGYGPYQAAADVLQEKYKGTNIAEQATKGNPGEGYVGYDRETETVKRVEYPTGAYRVNGKKAEKTIGLKYVEFQQSIRDTADALEKLL